MMKSVIDNYNCRKIEECLRRTGSRSKIEKNVVLEKDGMNNVRY